MEEEGQLFHHKKHEFCTTRPVYREGRRLRAVKVYTINDESRYLIVQGVPAVGAIQELLQRFALFGRIAEYRILDEYPTADQFTDVFWIKYENIQSARIAKRKLDDISFFGGVLHVCYAPECESVDETREKLVERRKVIAAKCREYGYEAGTAAKSSVKIASATATIPDDTKGHEQPSESSNQLAIHVKRPLVGEQDRQLLVPNVGHNQPSVAAWHDGAAHSLWQVPGTGQAPSVTPYRSAERYPHMWPPLSSLLPTTSTASTEPRADSVPLATTARTAARVHAAAEAGVWQRTTFTDLPPDGINSERNVDATAALVARKGNSSRTNHAIAVRTQAIRAAPGFAAAPQTPDSTPLVIRHYSPRAGTTQPPRFVPRQAAGIAKTCRATSMATLANANSDKQSPIGNSSLDEEIKRNATVLGKMQGPAVTPGQAALLKATVTGSEVLDKTVYEIRGRIRKALSAVTDEHVTKKKLQQPRIEREDAHVSPGKSNVTESDPSAR